MPMNQTPVSVSAIVALVALWLVANPSHAAPRENEVQACVCRGMELEKALPAGGRADCVSETHAIEVDPTGKWAEALGQALYYAAETNRKPGIILFCKEALKECLSHSKRLELTIAAYGLQVDVTLHDQESLARICPELEW